MSLNHLEKARSTRASRRRTIALGRSKGLDLQPDQVPLTPTGPREIHREDKSTYPPSALGASQERGYAREDFIFLLDDAVASPSPKRH
jgi:hypothetical protein